LTSLPVLFRDPPSDLPPMSLQQEISPPLSVSGNALHIFADDTYLIIPASNVASRHIELANIQNWAKRNNLELNCDKSFV